MNHGAAIVTALALSFGSVSEARADDHRGSSEDSGNGAARSSIPLLRACKGKSAGAACSATIARATFEGICVLFMAEPFDGSMVCVPQPGSCTPSCGANGQSCCTPANTCQTGLSCAGGKCGSPPPACDVSDRLIAAIAAALPGTLCLPYRTDGAGIITIDVCGAPSAACGGSPGCAATISWGAISLAGGTVSVTANVSSTIGIQSTTAGAPSTCTATLSGPVQVSVPATVVTSSGTTQLTVTGSPSVNSSGVTVSGCPLLADQSLLAAIRDNYRGILELNLGPALSNAVAGASASCP